ncbi:uncharacterized protein SAPINGB_P005830 [Magnusiomyces paraingens]|uniref:Major facilitator superfamily (MFS) profile domain-containing protein n=1 Tax=Magnusiomyces paraingens TaxID=2606893 RepID=A0A5E8C729_9ASCO|nr:uncharacterized protein SAPINGB_P005830 [Saprochaete ingens]VVT57708.1 unnamed protein product [Saprochaete ingens]
MKRNIDDFVVLSPVNESVVVENSNDKLEGFNEEPILGTSLCNNESPSESYTIFSTTEMYLLSLFASFLALFSSISVPIYLPVLTELKKEFNVDTEKINLTIVTYSIFQGLAPAFWGPLADRYGRRPIYPFCLLIYIGANIGLAMAKNYAMLLVFRCLQAAGMAASVSLGAGMVGDITQRKNRGTFMGIVGGINLLGNALGPLIGAGIASTWNWRSIFWFLVISSGVALVLVVILYPETNRSLVGNGSIIPRRLINMAPTMIMFHRKQLISYETALETGKGMLLSFKGHSILRSFQLLFNKEVVLFLIPVGLHYTVWFVTLTIQSTSLVQQYNFTIIQIGLSYLANGLGSMVGSIWGGRLMTYYYERQSQKFKKAWAEEHGTETEINPLAFDIVKTRIKPGFYLSFIMMIGCIVFGWTIEKKIHWIVPIVMTLFISLTGVMFVTISNTLMVDLFPEESSSASACVNLVRCLLCAVGTAVIDRMDRKLGTGGSMTLLSGICGISLVGLVVEYKYGMEWNRKRLSNKTLANNIYS